MNRNTRRGVSAVVLTASVLTVCVSVRAQHSVGAAARPSITVLDSTKEQDGLLGSVRRVKTETAKIELKDGRVLVAWRGSNTATTAGRKWFSLSTDGGRTLSPVAEWEYDDGSRFYSPSSYHRMIRHSATKKLYWIGNICGSPPGGNSPRYPLVIAEVDESTPSLKKKTVSVIDDRKPEQPAAIQFSNF